METSKNRECTSRDLTGTKLFALMWVLTGALIAGQLIWERANLWLAAALLLSWGSFCTANMLRCGRVHCSVVGPLFLLGGAALVLLGLGVISFPASWLNLAVLGVLIVGVVAEMVLGKYTPTK